MFETRIGETVARLETQFSADQDKRRAEFEEMLKETQAEAQNIGDDLQSASAKEIESLKESASEVLAEMERQKKEAGDTSGS